MKLSSDRPLVLGSASPRRRDLVAMVGVPFVVRSASVDEDPLPDEEPRAYVERVTQSKLHAVRRQNLDDAGGVLVADTIVIAPGGALLGKPRDDEDARLMLERLAGRTHRVCTRFVLSPSAAGPPPTHAETVTTHVTFRDLSRREIDDYVAFGEGKDKAGGYAIQGRAGIFVQRIEGSFTNVVGLPVCEVVVAMRAAGWIETP